ncbi:hypothetical protein [Halorussus halophilus]|uniref:hypothetical protein n=1 Tax=Halorussus halophilus TaxID=2650975 RepID=UPI0013014773|nr:hypothetical protein [Halorussus halophilus]
MNVTTPPTIPCPACDGVAHAMLDDQWGQTEGWRCRSCLGYVELDGGRRSFDVTTIATGTEFELSALSKQVSHVTGMDSPRVVRVGETDQRYRVTTDE